MRIYTTEVRIYSIGIEHLIHDYLNLSIEVPNQVILLWPSVMKFAKSREFNSNTLLNINKFIHQTRGLKWFGWCFIHSCLYWKDSIWGGSRREAKKRLIKKKKIVSEIIMQSDNK